MLGKLLFLTLALTSCFVASQIVRPCALNDYPCIGRILALNSNCNRNVIGSVPAVYTIPRYRFEVPYFNASYYDINLVIRNSNNCRVSEFFADQATNIVVLAVNCPQLRFSSTRLLIQHASLSEDRFFRYGFTGTYPLIRLTTNLYYQNGLDLCRSFTFADVAALPTYTINPSNPQTLSYITPRNVFERELFFWRASLLGRFFINRRICDFGCNY